MKKDNSTFRKKVSLRRNLLSELDDPIVLEAYGGYGRLWAACYTQVEEGIVFEKDRAKAEVLARQRPAWAVYEGDCVEALGAGVGRHLLANLYDLDPWGDPWPALEAAFSGERPRPGRLCVAVTDGLRGKLVTGSGWACRSLVWAVQQYGNAALFANYRKICLEMFGRLAEAAGYGLVKWTSYYCGHSQQMTHYGAVLKKTS